MNSLTKMIRSRSLKIYATSNICRHKLQKKPCTCINASKFYSKEIRKNESSHHTHLDTFLFVLHIF